MLFETETMGGLRIIPSTDFWFAEVFDFKCVWIGAGVDMLATKMAPRYVICPITAPCSLKL